MYGGNGYGGGDGSGPFGWGQGGDPGNITIGNQQVPPKSGDAKDAGYPWGPNPDLKPKEVASIDDLIKSGQLPYGLDRQQLYKIINHPNVDPKMLS